MTYPKMISYEQALEIIHTLDITPLGVQQVPFKSALNRILAKDIIAPFNVPAQPTASMDGYAINFSDLTLLQSSGLRLLAPNKAGNPKRPSLEKGYAMKTFTGSLMPHNADTLILVEHVFEENGTLKLKPQSPATHKAQWVRQIGDNYKQGEVLLKKGDKVGAFEIGLLAELNMSFVSVYQKAKVGILCVGDEILEVGSTPREGAVYSVNAHLLESLLIQAGHEAIIYPLIGDDKASLESIYKHAIKECDMLLTAGGMSMGDFDFTQEIMQECANMCFKGVRLKPGKPVALGIAKAELSNPNRPTIILGLPGFPNSCAITFLLFGASILARLHGREFAPLRLRATLKEGIKRKDPRMEFRACEVENSNGILQVSFEGKKSLQSSMINNLTKNTALALLPESGGDLAANDDVEIMLLGHLASF